MKEILKEDWKYILYENEGGYFMTVVCGTIAVFDISFQLSEEETKLFLENGKSYIENLASTVSYYPNEYIKRRR